MTIDRQIKHPTDRAVIAVLTYYRKMVDVNELGGGRSGYIIKKLIDSVLQCGTDAFTFAVNFELETLTELSEHELKDAFDTVEGLVSHGENIP